MTDTREAALRLVCEASPDLAPLLYAPAETPRGALTEAQLDLQELLFSAVQDDEARQQIKDAVLFVYMQTALYWCERGIKYGRDEATNEKGEKNNVHR